MAAETYRAVFGHVGGILPGTAFESRQEVKDAQLHKEQRAGISWGRDEEGERAADAIILSEGYEDDRDDWDTILYTGAGGRDANTGRQISDQDWENNGNAGLRRSRIKRYPVRVIRGRARDLHYAPSSGYRYDGLYEVIGEAREEGVSGFQICRFSLRRLPEERQELTPVEQQVKELLDGAPPRVTSTVERVVRDTAVARKVKRWYEHTCQICRTPLWVGAGVSYAEGAHIQALGRPSNGPDVEGNVLCLCPNCHIRLDRGAIYLTDRLEVVDRFADASAARAVALLTVEKHRIQATFLRAHRRFWGIDPAGA
ncbi:HNH endonuclease [Streptomyces sp. NBC_01167]|uniref:YDG/SRA domain-containing protein n=1 Tax=Streptomyces sp. NBC_01167 TaxID=2903756 RepID=UPI0038631AE5|nr:HNH endonuclease [Streptomyces sp. NBC_01167]